MVIEVPQSVAEMIHRLNELCTEYPIKIPLTAAAEFLGTHPNSLRTAIEQNPRLFGICWQQTLKGNRAYCIPTVTFWMWYMNGKGLEMREGS